jgi:hypothetical protein
MQFHGPPAKRDFSRATSGEPYDRLCVAEATIKSWLSQRRSRCHRRTEFATSMSIFNPLQLEGAGTGSFWTVRVYSFED